MNKWTYCLLLLLATLYWPLTARPQACPLLAPLPDSLDLQTCTSYYVDSSKLLAYPEVLQRPFRPLAALGRKQLKVFRYPTWLKITLYNPADSSIHAYLDLGRHYRITLWRTGARDSLLNGKIVARASRAFRLHYKYFPVELAPGQEVQLVLRIQNFAWRNADTSPELIVPAHLQRQLLHNIYGSLGRLFEAIATIGISFFLFLFTALQYWHNRDKIYLHYSLYLFSLAFYFLLSLEIGGYYDFFLSRLGTGYFYLELLLNQIPIVFYAWFVQAFFEMSRRQARIHTWLNRLVVLVLGVLCAQWVLLGLGHFALARLLFLLLRIVSFVAAVWLMFMMYVKFRHINYAKYIILGSFLATVGALLTTSVAALKNVVPSLTSNTVVFARVGLLAEFLFFSFTLGLRNKQIEEERNLAQTALSRQEAENQLMRNQLMEAEIKALKAQINPHFISNCLTAIKALIQKGKREEAIAYLQRFSKLIRLTMDYSMLSEIRLKEELAISKLYLELEALRLGKNFHYELQIPQGMPGLGFVKIPPFILQPFLENAIWHGLQPKEKGQKRLVISLEEREEGIACIIEDNGVGRDYSRHKQTKRQRASVGIRNVQERLELFNKSYLTHIHFQIIDQYAPSGQPAGTRVQFFFPY